MSIRLHRIDIVEHRDGLRVERRWADACIADPLGVDPAREVAAQRLAAARGLAPEVLAFDPLARTMQMAFVPGEALEADWLRRPARREAMVGLLERLAQLSPCDLPRLDLGERLCALHRELAIRAPHEAERFTVQLTAVLHSARLSDVLERTAAEQACLVHGDVTPDNIRVRPDGSLLLIDWEYAHAGHPLEDLAGLIAQTPESLTAWADEAADFREFAGVTDGSLGARVRLRRLLDALWKAVAATSAGVSWTG